MGQLHYTDEQALRTSVVRLKMAHDGVIKWHNAIHGAGKPKQKRQAQQDVAAQLRGFAAWHNAKMAQKDRGGMGR